jgi:monofunctional chorismate mutase
VVEGKVMEDILVDLRKKIDVVDKDILALVLKRLELVDQVAEVKKANKIPVFVPGREDEILDGLVNGVDSKYSSYVRDLFINILDISKRYQIERD